VKTRHTFGAHKSSDTIVAHPPNATNRRLRGTFVNVGAAGLRVQGDFLWPAQIDITQIASAIGSERRTQFAHGVGWAIAAQISIAVETLLARAEVRTFCVVAHSIRRTIIRPSVLTLIHV
jgi:hypothetical protein